MWDSRPRNLGSSSPQAGAGAEKEGDIGVEEEEEEDCSVPELIQQMPTLAQRPGGQGHDTDPVPRSPHKVVRAPRKERWAQTPKVRDHGLPGQQGAAGSTPGRGSSKEQRPGVVRNDSGAYFPPGLWKRSSRPHPSTAGPRRARANGLGARASVILRRLSVRPRHSSTTLRSQEAALALRAEVSRAPKKSLRASAITLRPGQDWGAGVPASTQQGRPRASPWRWGGQQRLLDKGTLPALGSFQPRGSWRHPGLCVRTAWVTRGRVAFANCGPGSGALENTINGACRGGAQERGQESCPLAVLPPPAAPRKMPRSCLFSVKRLCHESPLDPGRLAMWPQLL